MRDANEPRRFERERGLAGTFTCRTCAGSDMPGYIDRSHPSQQGIHDWMPCVDCNPNHFLHSQSSTVSMGHRPTVVPFTTPMPEDLKLMAKEVIDQARVNDAKARKARLDRERRAE